MKITIEIPDDLFRQTQTMAALRGQTLKDLMTTALRTYLKLPAASPTGWRRVFGQVDRSQVEEVDEIVAEEFGRVSIRGLGG
jgi:hypothetical protein